MNERQSHSSPATLIAVALVTMIVVAYIGGYFLLGRREYMPGTKKQARIIVFRHMWQVQAYQPLTHLEQKITGVQTYSNTDDLYSVLSD